MIAFIKKYALVFLFIYISLWTALASTPMNEVIAFPTVANQLFSLLLYVPFLAVILWKLWSDLKNFKLHFVNIVYYLFAFYYVALSAYRLVTGMEVKESVYHAVTLLGAFALFLQIYDGHYRISGEDFNRNLLGIGIFMAVLKLIISFLEGGFFSLSPLNNLYSTSVLVMLLPVLFAGFREHKGVRGVLYWGTFSVSVLLIMICSSRAITLLSIGILGVLMLFTLCKIADLGKFLSAILCAAILVGLMGVCNIGLVRRSLYREFGVRWPVSSTAVQDPENEEMESPEMSDEELMQTVIDAQINNSDNMRAELLQRGIREFKKSPIFGTGDLYYTYDMGYKTMEQTAHNFLVECLVCYGIIGTLMIAALVTGMLIGCGLFKKFKWAEINNRVYLLLSMFHYFALGCVQPSVFNTFLCPLFALLLAYYGRLILPQQPARKSLSLFKGKAGKELVNGTEE